MKVNSNELAKAISKALSQAGNRQGNQGRGNQNRGRSQPQNKGNRRNGGNWGSKGKGKGRSKSAQGRGKGSNNGQSSSASAMARAAAQAAGAVAAPHTKEDNLSGTTMSLNAMANVMVTFPPGTSGNANPNLCYTMLSANPHSLNTDPYVGASTMALLTRGKVVSRNMQIRYKKIAYLRTAKEEKTTEITVKSSTNENIKLGITGSGTLVAVPKDGGAYAGSPDRYWVILGQQTATEPPEGTFAVSQIGNQFYYLYEAARSDGNNSMTNTGHLPGGEDEGIADTCLFSGTFTQAFGMGSAGSGYAVMIETYKMSGGSWVKDTHTVRTSLIGSAVCKLLAKGTPWQTRAAALSDFLCFTFFDGKTINAHPWQLEDGKAKVVNPCAMIMFAQWLACSAGSGSAGSNELDFSGIAKAKAAKSQ